VVVEGREQGYEQVLHSPGDVRDGVIVLTQLQLRLQEDPLQQQRSLQRKINPQQAAANRTKAVSTFVQLTL